MTFEEVLKVWAKRRILADNITLTEDEVEVTSADVYERTAQGFCHTCWTEAYIEIVVDYQVNGSRSTAWYEAYDREGTEYLTLTSMVRTLEKIAEESNK